MKDLRIAALIRFSLAITILNIFGFLFLGFEQSYAHPFISLATAYSFELLFEFLEAKIQKRKVKFKGGFKKIVFFLLPAHITGLAVSMLLYTNEQFGIQIFASAFAILSKYIFKVNVNGKQRHFLNPSNTGIAITLVLFPWVGISQPYMFTENIHGLGNWFFPMLLVTLGTLLNTIYTKKIPLIVSWLLFFILQAIIRSIFFDANVYGALLPMTGIAFLLFTFYMVSDPGTTPKSFKGQVLFGSAVAIVYSSLVIFHIVFGLFFALLIVCFTRGVFLYIKNAVSTFNQKSNLLPIKEIKPQILSSNE